MRARRPVFVTTTSAEGHPVGRTLLVPAYLVAACLSWHPPAAAAQDRMGLVTGVVLEGEIKGARRGKLSFDNDELDVVSVDIEDVAELMSPRFFEVTEAERGVLRGSLAAGDSGMVVIVAPGSEDVPIEISNIVEMRAFDSGFWGRTNGHLDIGANVARANSLSSFLIGSAFAYRGIRWGLRSTVDGYWQEQTNKGISGRTSVQTTDRLSFGLAVSRYILPWAIQASGDWSRNEELDLEARFQFGAQGIYKLVENLSMAVQTGAGLVNNTERYVGRDESTTAEIVVAGIVDAFDIGDVDVYAAITTFANLQDRGRFRFDIDGRLSWEIIDDFTIGFTIVERIDNRPPVAGTPKRDYQYGLTLGLNWG